MISLKKALGALAIAAALIPAAASAKDYRLGLITPPPHQWTKTAQAFSDVIAEKTDGRVKILIFPSGQLGNESQMLQQMQTGALDFAFLTVGEMVNRRADYGALLAPYLVKDSAGAKAILTGPTAQGLLADLKSLGLVGLGWGMAGLRQVVMANDVSTVDDLKGRKVRIIPIQTERDFWTMVGAAPTPMPLPAVYDAFANGQVDGMQIDFEGTWNSRYVDHAGTIIESSHMMLPMAAVASARVWPTISEEDRKTIEAELPGFLEKMLDNYEQIEAEYLEKLKGTDVKVIKADREWFGPAVDQWYEEWHKKSPLLEKLEAEAGNL